MKFRTHTEQKQAYSLAFLTLSNFNRTYELIPTGNELKKAVCTFVPHYYTKYATAPTTRHCNECTSV